MAHNIWNIILFIEESYVYTTTKYWGFNIYSIFMNNMQIWLLQKVFPFSSKLARGSEQLSWLVKRNTFFQK